MIGFIKGTVLSSNNQDMVVDVGGVGYELCCSQFTVEKASAVGDGEFWIHTHVREDAFHLYGFMSLVERSVFRSLIKVNGVGPKLAMTILSGCPFDRLVQMIEDEDAKALTKLPKVGKKTAEQMILTLRGKLTPEAGSTGKFKATNPIQKTIHSALVNLGYKPGDVEEALTHLPKDVGLQDGVKRGLQILSGVN